MSRRLPAALAALAATAVVLAGGPSPAPAAAPVLPACALGSGTAGDRAALRREVDAQIKPFVRRESPGPAVLRTYAAGLAAYLYGFPTVQFHATVLNYPRNQIVGIGQLADPSTVQVVAPNHDTLYSVSQVDLTDGPLLLETPPTAGRYAVVQLLDAFTNAFAYVGDGAAGAGGERAAIVPPGWAGTLPAGVRLIRAPTRTLWLLGRTLSRGAADQATAKALLGRYSLTPLTDALAGTRRNALVLDAFPANLKRVIAPTGIAFFDVLGADLARDPAPARDACALRAFAAGGVGAGRTPSTQLTGARRRAAETAATDGAKLLSGVVRHRLAAARRTGHGWTSFPKDIARFGTDYASRALVATVGLGANTAEKAIYPSTTADDHGRPLDGRHTYVLRFKPGQSPPVRAFWSLTLYDARILLYANPLQRYALGDRSPGLKRDPDGGLTIRVSHATPPAAQRSNWLPAPTGPFSLYLRLYEPKARAASGGWVPPAVRRIG